MHYRSFYKRNQHKYANPFFPKNKHYRKDKAAFTFRKILLIAVIFLTIIGWLYLFLFSKYFRISRIEISGDGKAAEAAVRDSLKFFFKSRSWLLFPKNNIYIFPAKEAENLFKEQLLLQEIKIIKIYPAALRVEFKTKKPALKLNTEKWIYILNITGEIIEKKQKDASASSTVKFEDDDLPIILGDTEDLNVASKAIKEELAQFIVAVAKALPEQTGVAISEFSSVADSPSSLNVKTEEGWNVVFNIRINVQEQIKKLAMVLKEQTLQNRKNLNYIDLRFGDRIFYK